MEEIPMAKKNWLIGLSILVILMAVAVPMTVFAGAHDDNSLKAKATNAAGHKIKIDAKSAGPGFVAATGTVEITPFGGVKFKCTIALGASGGGFISFDLAGPPPCSGLLPVFVDVFLANDAVPGDITYFGLPGGTLTFMQGGPKYKVDFKTKR